MSTADMRTTLVRFRVRRIIVHDMPKPLIGTGDGPNLSEVESAVSDELRTFFTDRIRESLTKAAVDAVFTPSDEHVMPPLILGQLSAQPNDFVEMSQSVGQHLHESQSGRNSPGILVVLLGSIGPSTPCVGIMKLERQSGVRLEPIVTDGHKTFDILAVRNLMLTEKTKVFKAAFFVQTGEGAHGVQALISDLQRTASADVADFFLGRFLGCQRREVPEVLTRQFFELTSKWIDDNITDSQTKVRYQIGLISELNRNSESINPFDFVRDQLQGDDRNGLYQYLTENGIPQA